MSLHELHIAAGVNKLPTQDFEDHVLSVYSTVTKRQAEGRLSWRPFRFERVSNVAYWLFGPRAMSDLSP
jgi:hypothetical protein